MKTFYKILIPLVTVIAVNCSQLKNNEENETEKLFDALFLTDIVMMGVKPAIQSEGVKFGNLYYKELSSNNPTSKVKVSNTGSAELIISEISMYKASGEKEETEVFEIENPGEIRLQPGSSRELTITFKAKEKDSYYRYLVFKNNSEYAKEFGVAIRASVTGYAKAKCGDNGIAVRVENKESTQKTFHFYKSIFDCLENNIESASNSAALYTVASVPAKSTTEYKCIELSESSFILVAKASGDTNCHYGTSDLFYTGRDYKVIQDSSVSNFISIEEESK